MVIEGHCVPGEHRLYCTHVYLDAVWGVYNPEWVTWSPLFRFGSVSRVAMAMRRVLWTVLSAERMTFRSYVLSRFAEE